LRNRELEIERDRNAEVGKEGGRKGGRIKGR
jgi:hypothetical protein